MLKGVTGIRFYPEASLFALLIDRPSYRASFWRQCFQIFLIAGISWSSE